MKMRIQHFISMLPFWISSPTARQDYIHSGAIDDPSNLHCPIANPVPIFLPSRAWHQDITDELTCLRGTDIFDLPRARHLLELDEMIEQYAGYLTVTETRRYWDIACVFTKIARCLRKSSCDDIVQLMARGSDFLRVEESRMKDETARLQSFYDQAGMISDTVLRDAQAAQRVQFSGEDDPTLLEQKVQAEDSLLQWTHLPGRLKAHLARTKEICATSIHWILKDALPIYGLREWFDSMTSTLSATPQINYNSQDTMEMVRSAIYATMSQMSSSDAIYHFAHSYYSELFGSVNASTQETRLECLQCGVVYLETSK